MTEEKHGEKIDVVLFNNVIYVITVERRTVLRREQYSRERYAPDTYLVLPDVYYNA